MLSAIQIGHCSCLGLVDQRANANAATIARHNVANIANRAGTRIASNPGKSMNQAYGAL